MAGMAAPIEQASGFPVAPPSGGEWTVDLLDRLPDDNLRYEILDGILRVRPSPIPVHQRAIGRLYRTFDDACPADHEVFVAPLDWRPDERTSLEPDLLVVAKERIGETRVPTG